MSDLRTELDKIYKQHKKLTPKLVVQKAKSKDHPLHSYIFDKGEKQAAEAYYVDRARELIRKVRIRYRDPVQGEDSSAGTVRAYHSVQDEKGYLYEPAENIKESPLKRKIILANMEREWKQMFARYEQFEEFLTMVRNHLSERDAA